AMTGPLVPHADVTRLIAGEHTDPHHVLGAHAATVNGAGGAIVRAMHPDAVAAECILSNGDTAPMEPVAAGVFAVFLPGATLPLHYRLRLHFANGAAVERDDPYRFLPTVGELDLHLFNEGTHRRVYQALGAHARTMDGVTGTSFAVWAPNARRVSVIGDFNAWDGRVFPMRSPGALYKYEILTPAHALRVKTDPFAFAMELPPDTASRVVSSGMYDWGDDAW